MNYKFLRFIGFTVLALASCHADPSSNLMEEAAQNTPDQISFDAKLKTTNKGELVSEIHYKRMERYASKREVRFLDGVRFDFYDELGLTSTVKSNEAILDERTSHIEFDGDVRVTSREGISLFSEKLYWDDSNGQMSSDSFVTVITVAADTMHGTGFESEKSFRNWLLRRPYGVTQQKLNLDKSEE